MSPRTLRRRLFLLLRGRAKVGYIDHVGGGLPFASLLTRPTTHRALDRIAPTVAASQVVVGVRSAVLKFDHVIKARPASPVLGLRFGRLSAQPADPVVSFMDQSGFDLLGNRCAFGGRPHAVVITLLGSITLAPLLTGEALAALLFLGQHIGLRVIRAANGSKPLSTFLLHQSGANAAIMTVTILG